MSKVNINLADVEALAQLNGIGEVLATRIIKYRETVHLFEEIIELTAVPGISERMVRQFEDQVSLEDDELDVAEVTETAVTPNEEDSTVDEVTDEIDEEMVEAVAESETVYPREDVGAVMPDEEESEVDEAVNGMEVEETTPPVAEDMEESETSLVAEPDESQSESEKPQSPPPPTFPEPTRLSEEQEPTMRDDPTDEPETGIEEITNYVTSEEPMARRRGCLFVIIGTVAGAILGMALTLALLASLNGGNLRFANAEVGGQLQNQIEAANLTIEAMSAELDSTNENLSGVATRSGATASDLNTAVSDIEQSLDDTQNDVATAAADIEGLAETAVELDKRIDTISSAAETFNQFLDGMRDLLIQLQGESPATPTPVTTPEATATGATATATQPSTPKSTTPESTRIPTRTTRIPTRTPRPTATPLTLPTITPAQQP